MMIVLTQEAQQCCASKWNVANLAMDFTSGNTLDMFKLISTLNPLLKIETPIFQQPGNQLLLAFATILSNFILACFISRNTSAGFLPVSLG